MTDVDIARELVEIGVPKENTSVYRVWSSLRENDHSILSCRQSSSMAATWYDKVQSVTTYSQVNRKGMRIW